MIDDAARIRIFVLDAQGIYMDRAVDPSIERRRCAA
jgi:hypothetical protein